MLTILVFMAYLYYPSYCQQHSGLTKPIYMAIDCGPNLNACDNNLLKICFDDTESQKKLRTYKRSSVTVGKCDYHLLVSNATIASMFCDLNSLFSTIQGEINDQYNISECYIIHDPRYDVTQFTSCLGEPTESSSIKQMCCADESDKTNAFDLCSIETTLRILEYAKYFFGKTEFYRLFLKSITNQTLTEIDGIVLANILNRFTRQNNTFGNFSDDDCFYAIDTLLSINKTMFRESKRTDTAHKILKFIDNYLATKRIPTFFEYRIGNNYVTKIIRFFKVNANYHVSLRRITLANVHAEINATFVFTVFYNNNLFPDDNIVSDIVNLKLSNVGKSLANPISIYFRPSHTSSLLVSELVCSFWEMSNIEVYHWSADDLETIRIEDDLIECRTTRLGAVTLLKISDKHIKPFAKCSAERIKNNGIEQEWCETNVGQTVISCRKPCANENGSIVTRTCEEDPKIGARWAEVEDICASATYSETTKCLVAIPDDMNNKSTLEYTSNCTKDTNLMELDITITANILYNYTTMGANIEEVPARHFFNTVNNLLNANRSIFKNPRKVGITDKILKSIDNFLMYLSKETSEPINITHKNFACLISKPTQVSGSDYNVSLNDISVKIPTELNGTSILTVFKNSNLFPEGDVISDIVDLKIIGVSRNITNPISIYVRPSLRNKLLCSFWKLEDNEIGNWFFDGLETIQLSSDVIECRTTHLTAFALLAIADKVVTELSDDNQLALRVLSTILCTLSLIGLSIVFVTCVYLKNWYKKRMNSIQLCFIITLEIFMLILDDIITIDDGLGCVFFGVFLHYLVLTKFMLMLLIARMQYDNFVTVLTSRNRSRNILPNAIINFSVPIIIIAISAGVFSDNYRSGNVQFCYPKDEAFVYFLILPISLILLANVIIFSLVMIKITKSISRDIKQKILQLKLAVMLFFMLGLSWFFSVLSQIIYTNWIQYIFVYAFTIFGALQGFVIFLFSVVMDIDARRFWLVTFNNLRYAPLETHDVTSNTMSTAVTFSNKDQTVDSYTGMESTAVPKPTSLTSHTGINYEDSNDKELPFIYRDYKLKMKRQQNVEY